FPVARAGGRSRPEGEQGPGHHLRGEGRRHYGEGEEGVRGLLDQLQGLQGLGRVHLRRLADRAVRDDEEDLGLREAEEAGRQEVEVPRLLPSRAACVRRAALLFCSSAQRGIFSSESITRSGRTPSSSSGAPVRLHQTTWRSEEAHV